MAKQTRPKLKPSARDKRRYIKTKAKNKEIEKAILEYIGTKGYAQTAYKHITKHEHKGYTIGSCKTETLEDVRTALTIKNIEIETISGTIKGLRKKQ